MYEEITPMDHDDREHLLVYLTMMFCSVRIHAIHLILYSLLTCHNNL